MKIKNLTARVRQALLLSSAMATAAFAPALLAAENNPAMQALFDQATYWHQKAHDELARDALQKILMVDAGNAQALYLMALYSQQSGDSTGAAQWRNRLSQVSPQDPRLAELDNAKQLQSIPQAQLSLARQQARSGNVNAALQTWRNTFSGNEPPASIAAEYYLTMAGDRNLRPQAIDSLRQFAARHPQDAGAQLALGKALTWQESTRREGLQVLQGMADGNTDADRSMRQALLWLGPQPQDAALYQTWQQRHPQDSAVMEYYRKNVGGAEKGRGFTALNSGDVAGAQSSFEQVLQANPQDADALAGLGYAAQRSGNYTAAADYLERSAKLGGDNSQQRQQQASDARFYSQLANAQQALKTGDTTQALALSAPLAQAEGEKGVAARLFRADALRRANQLDEAEQTYRAVLQADADNRSAKEGLFYVLRQQNRTAEANTLLSSLPASVRESVTPRPVATSEPVRQQAKQALTAGNSQQAIAILQQGLQRFPNDGWLRLDLARIYRSQGDSAAAANVMQPVFRNGASSNELYAGALNASESGAWQQANTLLSRIPARSQNAEMRTLAQRVNFNLQMSTAEQYLAQGSNAAAANTLKALAASPPANPADAGKLAQNLAQAGDLSSAVAVVRNNMQRGVQGNAGDYAAQVAVLNQAGLTAEAQNFLSNPSLQARSTPTQLAGIRNGYVINEVDRLREQKQYAQAYDKLISALQSDPQNSDLMFAMARLYQSGKMNKEAGVVYDYLLTRDTPTQDAREGSINVALALNDVPKARALTQGLRGEQTPERLLLMARVSEAEGNHNQALGYLRTARGKMIGLQGAETGSTPSVGGLALADNPFINRSTPDSRRPASTYGATMPWQTAPDATSYRDIGGQTAAVNAPTLQSRTLKQINTMMDDLQERTGTWAQGGVEIRGRDGESGLSKLTEAKAPLTWSSVPFGDSRFEFTVTPVSLSAGSADGQSSRRFGTGALSQAVSAAVQTLKNEEITKSDGTDYTFDDLNPLTTKGKAALASVQNSLASATDKANLDDVTVDSPGSQNASGVELKLALSGDQYKIDLGSTPLGQDLSTLVGGIQWSPKLTDYLTLILTGERRPVTDSLLSYVGATDKLSGESWGRVTKNGGNALLSYDDGDAGFYAGAGAYSYLGENVTSNKSLVANAGAYIRPFHFEDRELKTGISMSWMDFSKNLSYYSYGQGGYFSPQDYVSVSFPVEYSQKYDDMNVRIGGSVGYQSYSQDRSAYFPNNPDWQNQLETAVTNGYATEAYYSGGSKNGIGYNLHAGADYKVNKDVTVGGQLGYDTFGDYNESTAKLYFRYMLGDK
ncbi:cellulose synthase subunit BcsC-related outer membrane protein [Erwiniaceae bacterium BAC15a-03b]|uniref:Cellulose synthase subunit BcsC-related outer membrane protein n=1 Tax=Winslowiella arboricola TaxID=2978220 RepID=A0A9J6PSL9_9GAMM|nr:cellulose biosynthesis protein BcsC [Winslowiella arboricola]MCU5773838.1 cellulose synthase subunit BcsC-related outer membrane protein [Winslowiella arboricola]MCU5777748.1 cellulose synthase subunit BcsC-related outer membrane protein [Winslowiella arboricola]